MDTNDYKCHCNIGYKGDVCIEREEFIDTNKIQLFGDGFVSFSNDYLPHSSIADEIIKFNIKTEEDDGLIFFEGQGNDSNGLGKDFLEVALIDGKIEFSYELGSGVAKIKSTIKVNDGEPHSIVVKRKGREGSLEIDGKHKSYGESSGVLQMLNTEGDLYLGGVPNFMMTADRHKSGFVGCIYDLQIGNSGVIDIVANAKSARNVRSCDDEYVI